ncbi:hypothetical protein [Trinickia diaoshuihuensis]|jgi:hypothetical protein|uniref:hypothetical protein n=1 Tax=Trinickia diaoshuihuensis TaxID=2292265 RepID=UPI0013C37A73|nr:hypothetical protein [Trinickia diaoshuihuensis]
MKSIRMLSVVLAVLSLALSMGCMSSGAPDSSWHSSSGASDGSGGSGGGSGGY